MDDISTTTIDKLKTNGFKVLRNAQKTCDHRLQVDKGQFVTIISCALCNLKLERIGK
jgi:hypothetical protein